jgi:hypothetical protein
LPVRLSSQRDSSLELILTDSTWQALLDLAEEYGWNPFGPVLPWQWDALELDLSGYAPGDLLFGSPDGSETGRRLVVLDDALNLADALERAFMDYEPTRVPASFYLFAPEEDDALPSLGALTETLQICQKGAFWIEEYRRHPD